MLVTLFDPKCGHLGTDECPERDVVVDQARRVVFAGELVIDPLEGVAAYSGVAETLEVHRQERHVGEDVAVPEVVGEVEAVQHTRAVGQAEDVICEQVAVSVADPPFGDPVFEQRGAPSEVAHASSATSSSTPRSKIEPAKCAELIEIRLELRGDPARRGRRRR